ncbi:hypothetical protein GCM10010080_20990 [Thermomonas carbonis]|nr:hypothetical protein GCM10010080_20990 [Thermomonas carbonis]
MIAATVIRFPKAFRCMHGLRPGSLACRQDRQPVPGGSQWHARYNNQDHSMLTAKAAVDNIISGRVSTDNIWDINFDDDYHESESTAGSGMPPLQARSTAVRRPAKQT